MVNLKKSVYSKSPTICSSKQPNSIFGEMKKLSRHLTINIQSAGKGRFEIQTNQLFFKTCSLMLCDGMIAAKSSISIWLYQERIKTLSYDYGSSVK